MDVQHAPQVSVTPGLDYTKSSTEVEVMITFNIYASPLATVEWYKDEHLMEANENVIIVIPVNDTEMLREDRLGIYECR